MMPSIPPSRTAFVLVVGACVVLASANPAWAGDRICRADPPIAAAESTDALLTAADALVNPLDRPRARALYLAVLARDPNDEQAAVGLARADAADGCYALAEEGYRAVLRRSPANTEAAAGLTDVLVWTSRLAEAQAVLDEALRHEPLAPELLSRRARVAYFRGDVGAAKRWVGEAARVSPLDPEVQSARDRIYLGQARLGQRIQLFPSGYDDITTTDASGMLRWRTLRFEAGATVVTRHGATRATRSGELATTIIDGRPSGGVYYHFGNGAWAGGSFGVSAPALALPRWAYGLAAFTPLGRIFSAHLSTAYWQYRDGRDVAILSPALGVAVTEDIDVTARYWLTSVIFRDPAGELQVDHVHSAGVRVGWRPAPRWALGVDYTYGVQLERNPTAAELLDLRSHIVSLLAMHLFDRSFGVDAALSLERRSSLGTAPSVFGPAAEVGVFTRW